MNMVVTRVMALLTELTGVAVVAGILGVYWKAMKK